MHKTNDREVNGVVGRRQRVVVRSGDPAGHGLHGGTMDEADGHLRRRTRLRRIHDVGAGEDDVLVDQEASTEHSSLRTLYTGEPGGIGR